MRGSNAGSGGTPNLVLVAFSRRFGEMSLKFSFFVEEIICVRRCIFFNRYIWPDIGKFGVQFEPFLQIRLRIRLDCLGRAFGFANPQSMHSSGWITSMFSPS